MGKVVRCCPVKAFCQFISEESHESVIGEKQYLKLQWNTHSYQACRDSDVSINTDGLQQRRYCRQRRSNLGLPCKLAEHRPWAAASCSSPRYSAASSGTPSINHDPLFKGRQQHVPRGRGYLPYIIALPSCSAQWRSAHRWRVTTTTTTRLPTMQKAHPSAPPPTDA